MGLRLQRRDLPCYHILSISVSGAFQHRGYSSLQADLTLLNHARVVRKPQVDFEDGSNGSSQWCLVMRIITITEGVI